METVSVTRTYEATPEEIQTVVSDTEAWLTACGFDDVTVEDDHAQITNAVGLLTIELELRLLDTEELLAYEQVEGIFDEMVTRYDLTQDGDETTLTATTEFALDASIVGPILDATIITRQRRKELTRQFDYLETALEYTEQTSAN